jgi:hypothetical protein
MGEIPREEEHGGDAAGVRDGRTGYLGGALLARGHRVRVLARPCPVREVENPADGARVMDIEAIRGGRVGAASTPAAGTLGRTVVS